jgi:hypothetical protein
MTKLLAPNLPLPIERCETCTTLPKNGLTKSLIDAYVQHHRDMHGWTEEIGWQQTYEWAYGPDWRSKIQVWNELHPDASFTTLAPE